jgi:hypothetical protein
VELAKVLNSRHPCLVNNRHDMGDHSSLSFQSIDIKEKEVCDTDCWSPVAKKICSTFYFQFSRGLKLPKTETEAASVRQQRHEQTELDFFKRCTCVRERERERERVRRGSEKGERERE